MESRKIRRQAQTEAPERTERTGDARGLDESSARLAGFIRVAKILNRRDEHRSLALASAAANDYKELTPIMERLHQLVCDRD